MWLVSVVNSQGNGGDQIGDLLHLTQAERPHAWHAKTTSRSNPQQLQIKAFKWEGDVKEQHQQQDSQELLRTI